MKTKKEREGEREMEGRKERKKERKKGEGARVGETETERVVGCT